MSLDILNLDVLIVVGFLITTFIVGIGQGSNIKNIKDYALGGRNFSTGALVATIVATWIGGGTFFTNLSKTYTDGLYYTIASLGMPLCSILMAYIFIPKMERFLGKTSVAEAMGELYGKNIRIIVAIAGSIGSIGAIAVQFKVFGNIASYFLNFSAFEGIVIAAFIVTTYSAFGGIKAVTFTDVLQGFTFGLAIPIIGVMMWNHSYYEGFSLTSAFHDPKFNLSIVFDFHNLEFLSIIALTLYFSMPALAPAVFQRISMGRSIKQVKKAFIISAALILFINIATQWMSFLLFNVNPNLGTDQLFGYLVDNYAGIIGFKGLVISGVIALAMSTADSYINSASVLFSNDFCNPLNIGKNKELIISKIFAACLGVSGIFLATSAKNLLDIVLTANSFYMPVVTTPLMFTILGFRTSAKSVLIGMVAGFTTVIIWKFLEIKADCIVFAMMVNGIFLISSHYLMKQPGGWIAKDEILLQTLEAPEESTKRTNDFSWNIFCKKYMPRDDLSYIGLGVYLIIYTITAMYSTQVELLKENSRMILTIYQIMLVSGVAFLMYPIWPGSISREAKEKTAQILWSIVIFYMLVLFNCFFILVSNFSPLQFAVFTVNLLITSMLLGWRVGITMIVVGFYLAVKLHQIYNPHYNFDVYLGSPGFIMTYILLLIGATIVLFIKPKQEHLEETEAQIGSLTTKITDLSEKIIHYSERVADQEQEIERLGSTAQKILNNVNHELRLPVDNVVNFAEMLNDGLEKFDKSYLKILSEEVYKNSNRLSSMIMNMLDLATLNSKKLKLDKKIINLGELVEDRINNCRKIYLEKKKINFIIKIHPEIFVAVDPNYMRQVVDNLIINASGLPTA